MQGVNWDAEESARDSPFILLRSRTGFGPRNRSAFTADTCSASANPRAAIGIPAIGLLALYPFAFCHMDAWHSPVSRGKKRASVSRLGILGGPNNAKRFSVRADREGSGPRNRLGSEHACSRTGSNAVKIPSSPAKSPRAGPRTVLPHPRWLAARRGRLPAAEKPNPARRRALPVQKIGFQDARGLIEPARLDVSGLEETSSGLEETSSGPGETSSGPAKTSSPPDWISADPTRLRVCQIGFQPTRGDFEWTRGDFE